MAVLRGSFPSPIVEQLKQALHNHYSNTPMPETNELPDPAKLLKKVLAEANFANTDIGGAVFSLLDSLSYDITSQGLEEKWSDATEDLMQEVINILAKDYDEIRTDDLEDEEEEDELIPIISVEDDIEDNEQGSGLSDEIVAELTEIEEVEEIDDVEELPDLSDLEETEEVANGPGNQESANKG